jgi:methylglutaconyl-CoA hydratase
MPTHATLRPLALSIQRIQRLYYSTTSNAPLITVTHIPAPNSGHIRLLELNRPSARNAISRALLSALRAEIDDVHAQYDENSNERAPSKIFGGAAGVDSKGPTRAVIIASAIDSSFCAVADLKERKGFTKAEYEMHIQFWCFSWLLLAFLLVNWVC